jgi:predicted dehydrogenase
MGKKSGQKNLKPITAVIMGAGSRGRDAYGKYAEKYPNRIKMIAVAEPDEGKRKLFQKIHNIPDEMAFESWEQLLSKGKLADVAFITMQDHMHYEPCMKALDLNYDIVLEKPIAPKLEECQNIERKAIEKGRLVQVCHVLRFSPFWLKIKEIIDSGMIGNVIYYEHSENVSHYHFGHSFVRGFWKNKAASNPLILAKCCHDLDLITWMLGKPLEVKSTGSLSYYKLENAPKNAPERCTDGCPHSEECPWYAPRLYMTGEELIKVGTESFSRSVRIGAKFLLRHIWFRKLIAKIIPKARTLINWDQCQPRLWVPT